MKKRSKAQIIILIVLICMLSIHYIFNTDRFIHKNIEVIDKAETFTIMGDHDQKTYDFNEEMYELVSYGGLIIERDNLLERLFKPYYKELEEIDLSIDYLKDKSVLGTARVYHSKEEPDDYILYLNHVYWNTGSNLDDLLDLLNE